MKTCLRDKAFKWKSCILQTLIYSKLLSRKHFFIKNIILQTRFHSKTLSHKHVFIPKHYPANIFSFKNHISHLLYHSKASSHNDFSKKKSYPAITLLFKNLIPQLLFHSKTLPRKHLFKQKPLTYMWPFGMHRTQCAQMNWKCLVSKWIGAEDKLKAKLIKQLVRMAPCSNWGISICLFLFFIFIVAYKQLEYPRKHGLSDGLSTFAINPARLQSLLSNRAYCMPITAHWALCFQHLVSHNLGPRRVNFFINSYAYVSYFLLGWKRTLHEKKIAGKRLYMKTCLRDMVF